jgi:hypothetical protein
LKSKFGGNDPTSVGKRRWQAEQVKAVYDGLRRDGVEHVVVLGDFNDSPDSAPLQALLAAPPQSTDSTDLVHMADCDDGAPDDDRPGTFGNGTRGEKIDYLLMSPALFERATKAARMWGVESTGRCSRISSRSRTRLRRRLITAPSSSRSTSTNRVRHLRPIFVQ